MEATISCIYCNNPANLVTDPMIMTKGLAKIKIAAHHYECSVCKKTFQTNEQNMETASSIHSKQTILTRQNKDLRSGKVVRYETKKEK